MEIWLFAFCGSVRTVDRGGQMSDFQKPSIILIMDHLVELLINGRNEFLSVDNVNSIPLEHRSTILHMYMSNEILLISMINQLNRPSEYYTITIPDNFGGSVVVRPTAQQITSSLVDGTTTTSCPICQDAISENGCKIRQCSHFFHRSCIESWFSLSVRCPVCRFDIREEHQSDQTSIVSSQTPSRSVDL